MGSQPPKTKVVRCKKSIAQGKPVVIGMKVTESFTNVNEENPVWIPKEDDKSLGGHAMAVIGYNDSLGVFEEMNSWGNQWGDKGFFFISYKDFTKTAFQGIQLILPEEKLSPRKKQSLIARMEKAESEKETAAIREKQLVVQIEEAQKIVETESNPAAVNTAQEEVKEAKKELQKTIVKKQQANLEIQQTEDRFGGTGWRF